MPNFTNNEWIAVAVGAAFLMLAWQKGWLSQWFGKIQPKPAPTPAQPMIQYVEPTAAPQTLDDQVLSAASVLKGVSAARRDLKDAYALVDAHDAAVLEIRAKEQAKINAMAAKVEVK